MLTASAMVYLTLGIFIGYLARHYLPQSKLFISRQRIVAKAQIAALTHTRIDGFMIIDAQGLVIHTNPAILNIFGYDQDDNLVGIHIDELMQLSTHSTSSQDPAPPPLKALVNTENQLIGQQKNGDKLSINITVNQIEVSKCHYYVAFIKDISNEVQMYRQILHQRNKFETLFANCPDGMLYVDKDLKIIDANLSFLQLYGDSLDRLSGQNIKQLFQIDAPELQQVKDRLLSIGEHWAQSEILAKLLCPQPQQIWVLISYQQISEQKEPHYIYVFRDISIELKLIAHISEKNHTQELSEALVNMGYWRYDIDEKQLWCSDQILQILQLPKDQGNLIDINDLYQLVDPSQRQLVLDSIQSSISQFAPLSLALMVKTSQDHNRHIVLKGICESSSGKLSAIYGVFQDISEQLKQEESLRLAKERLELSQEFSNIGNWQWDLNQDKIFWSELTSPLFGESERENEHSFQSFISFIHPDDQQAVQDAMDRCILGSEKYDIEHRVIWQDKSVHWLHQQGNVVRDINSVATSMIGIVQDITERKERESELGLFKQIIESSEQAIMVLAPTGKILYTNPAHQQAYLHGGKSNQYQFNDFYVLADKQSELEHSIEQSGHWSDAVESQRSDKSQFPAYLSLSQFDDPSTKQCYRFGISYDISAQIEQKQTLNQAKIAAESANRAKSEFLSSMSHELRTPLNAVLGFSQLLLRQKDVPFTTRIQENIEAIYKAGEHLLTLINGILDLAKVESGNIDPQLELINVKEVIDEAVSMIAPEAQKQGLSLQTPEGNKIPILYSQRKIPIINGDYTLIKQALLNYLSNAIKYNKPDGKIYITVDIDEVHKIARITVSDNGIGMSADSLAKLFTPFNRLGLERSNIQGTGIGLAITKKNIEKLGGKVGVKSKQGIGSHFWLELPYLELSSILLPPMPIQPKTAGRFKALYIEENQSETKLMEEFFQLIKPSELICVNSTEMAAIYALEYQPQVILLDQSMINDMPQDVEKLQLQLTFYQYVMIVIGDDIQTNQTTALHFDDYLSKPLSLDELQTALYKHQLIENIKG